MLIFKSYNENYVMHARIVQPVPVARPVTVRFIEETVPDTGQLNTYSLENISEVFH